MPVCVMTWWRTKEERGDSRKVAVSLVSRSRRLWTAAPTRTSSHPSFEGSVHQRVAVHVQAVKNHVAEIAGHNAIAEVGPQLMSALVFVAITATFYANLGAQVPGLDTSSPAVRQHIAPLNPPAAGAPAAVAAAARVASTQAFHLAMLVASLLLLVGAGVSAVGIENPRESGTINAP